MSNHDAIKLAAELVRTALGAGWASKLGSGENLGKEIGEAIDALQEKLKEIDSR